MQKNNMIIEAALMNTSIKIRIISYKPKTISYETEINYLA